MNADSLTYHEHYIALKSIQAEVAEDLKNHDLDKLFPLMQEANTHYKAMKERLDTIEKLIDKNTSSE